VRCIRAWGLAPQFEKVVTKNRFLEFRNGLTDELLGHNPHNEKDWGRDRYGEEIWNINRRDYQDVLANAAISAGAKIIFGVEITNIDVDGVIVKAADGRVWNADVVIGADGIKSVVRKAIPALSDVEPIALIQEQAWRCTVPKETMRASPALTQLLNSGNEMAWTAPERYVLSWPLPEKRDYDVVTCVQQVGDVSLGKWGARTEPDDARKDFQDFCLLVRELLGHIQTSVKWTLAELPPLKTCRSENGRVVVIRDAFHAMIPHSASGGNSAIEDAACLGECLDWASKQPVSNGVTLNTATETATRTFEEIRKPRVERMQKASHEGYGFLGAQGDFQFIRDKALADATKMYDADLALPDGKRRTKPRTPPDMHARFPLEPYLQWLYGYDAVAATRKHLMQQR